MSENSKIEWCDHTFNPWIGCAKVSPGCDHCYAEADWDLRKHRVRWGAGNPRSRTSDANWALPLRWNRAHDEFFAAHGRRQRVFCASLADVFDNEVPSSWRADLFELIERTPHLDWLLLTKRIGNVSVMLRDTLGDIMRSERGWPWPNVWLGATIVNQEEANRDIPKLLRVPAHIRFISIEPMLGPIDLRRAHIASEPLPRVDWVIAGGESGHGARPMHPDWAYSLRDQCEAAGVPFLFKQWGEWASPGLPAFGTVKGHVRHIRSDGSFWDNPPNDENADCLTIVNVGKKAAGRLLGGVEHNGFPA